MGNYKNFQIVDCFYFYFAENSILFIPLTHIINFDLKFNFYFKNIFIFLDLFFVIKISEYLFQSIKIPEKIRDERYFLR